MKGSSESLARSFGAAVVLAAAVGCPPASPEPEPEAPVLELSFSQVKQLDFRWAAAAGAEHYQLLESAEPGEPFVQIGDDIEGEEISITMPLHLRANARYLLRACNAAGCTDSAPVGVVGSLAEAVGYFKASNGGGDFGMSVALSDDGSTLAVAAPQDTSSATGIDGDPTDRAWTAAGAVYVFVRDARGTWSQQAYVKASNTDEGDWFGIDVALSADGDTLVVGANFERSRATGIDGDQADDSAPQAGAAYVFVRDESSRWSQQAYVKASNTDEEDWFGTSVALSGDGNTLAVGALFEDSNATGIDGDRADDSAPQAGAVYVFVRDDSRRWSQQAYVKGSNTDEYDRFGTDVALSEDGNTLAVGADGKDSAGAVYVFVRDESRRWSQQAYVAPDDIDAGDGFGFSVALSGDGNALAVGAPSEDGNATGIDGDRADDSAPGAGAVYVFARDVTSQWSQRAHVKASNTDPYDAFGFSVALSDDGNALAVGAYGEDSSATGIDGDQADDSAPWAGAVYVFVRDESSQWSQQTYVKAPNTDPVDSFGIDVALSGNADTLAVGASHESSGAVGIGGDQTDESAHQSGAVYLY